MAVCTVYAAVHACIEHGHIHRVREGDHRGIRIAVTGGAVVTSAFIDGFIMYPAFAVTGGAVASVRDVLARFIDERLIYESCEYSGSIVVAV